MYMYHSGLLLCLLYLKALKSIDPHFVPHPIPENTPYVGPLIEKLNEPLNPEQVMYINTVI